MEIRESQVGPFQKIDHLEQHDEKSLTVTLATAQFARAKLVVRVVYDAHDAVTGLFIQPEKASWSTPPYANMDAFVETRVTVGTSPSLPGFLTLPKGDGPFPAVVLVHGSGPNDEDETVGAVKPFKDLAVGLASKASPFCAT